MSLARLCRLSSATIAITFALTGVSHAQVRPHAGMLRYPDVSATHIVFVYANDLWIVSREGGVASPLAAPPGGESFPKFSKDGKTIAFFGNYEGARDLYTIAIDGSDGGVPTQVTHHPSGERLCDWTPDGGLLFSAGDVEGLGQMGKLFTVPVTGGLPKMINVPYGTSASISDDGTWLAYTPHSIDNRTWKRYRGGMQTDIWLFNLKDNTSRLMTSWEGTDTLPMWHGKKVYYLSDAGPEHRMNIWEYDIEKNGGARKQVTEFKDYDVDWPSIGPGKNGKGEIVFQNGSGLYLLDLSNGKSRPVEVTIPGDRPTLRDRMVDVTKFISGWSVSSTGKRAAVEARGDIWTAPAENGSPRRLTSTSGVAERMPSWSPDGQWISYLSDATGEYELYIAQSDGKGETKQLTKDGNCWRYNMGWSPDSKHIVFADKTGSFFIHTIESGATKLIDKDPWASQPSFSWTQDSRWIAYDLAFNRGRKAIWIYNVETGEKKRVTSGFFNDVGPTFDRKGEWMYYESNRNLRPQYGDIPGDTTFIYSGTAVLLAVPLRNDVENPWAAKSDEEKWGEQKKEAESQPDKKNGEAKEGEAKPATPATNGDDGVSGTWEGTAQTPDGAMPFTLKIARKADNSVSADLSSMMMSFSMTGTWDAGSKTLTLSGQIPDGPAVTMTLKIDGESMSGSGEADGAVVPISATRKSKGGGEAGGDQKPEGDKKEEKPAEKTKVEPVKIDFEGFERRAIPLPVAAGQFGAMAVNDSNVLLYARIRSGEGPESGVYAFDMKDEKKEEKSVASGVTNFELSADGKKLLAIRGNAASIQNASAGGSGSSKNVITAGMDVAINPRAEWEQMFGETWRLYRDFFYVANLHGVDWPAIRKQYAAMLPDCVVREDLSYIISEMISELNVGHAYYSGGDVESAPNLDVGMLGCDFAIENGAYRISAIHEGAAWDSDARGPLSQPSVNVKVGDYLLAVNGSPLDTKSDPWKAFVGRMGEVVELTVSDKPTIDDTARRVLIKPIGGDGNLRYRAWIERNRKYVDEKSGGTVGYIYVPNTGRDGQTDLYRQFYGQMDKAALIIDERWNGGGQIPTRFIELLNRPRTNYWAVREGQDWAWPPDSHQGPKCMLINGLAGSGGDMFPWLFKQAGLGPLIGTRTWGGLVGISGNPGLIDGARVTVPTFGFYEKDGTWGIEGHGTDPDIEVIDDPALMLNGGDPQLDRAVEEMLKAIKEHPYVPAKRPADPDRRGMGVREEDK